MINLDQFPDVDIKQTTIDDGRGKITILRGGWTRPDAKTYMDEAVRQFVGNNLYNQFVEIHLDIPQVRIIVEGINSIRFDSIRDFYESQTGHGSR